MQRIKKTTPIHDTLTGYDFRVEPALTRNKAIRQKCLECQGGNTQEVRQCVHHDCPLWPWRHGRKPCANAPDRTSYADAMDRGGSRPVPLHRPDFTNAAMPRSADGYLHGGGYGEQAHV